MKKISINDETDLFISKDILEERISDIIENEYDTEIYLEDLDELDGDETADTLILPPDLILEEDGVELRIPKSATPKRELLFKSFGRKKVKLMKEAIVDEKGGAESFLGFIFSRERNHDKFLEFIEIYRMRKKISKKIALLHAHGYYDKTWCWSDGFSDLPIENFIKKNDGKYAVIILRVCNPTGVIIKPAKKSLIMMADTDFSTDSLSSGASVNGKLASGFNYIIHPQYGEINSYTIDYFLSEMTSISRKR